MPLKIPEGPYTIDSIMESIRAQVVEKASGGDSHVEPTGGAGPHLPAIPDPDLPRPLISDGTPFSHLLSQLELMRQRQSLQFDYAIRSHRRFTGRFIDLFKRFVWWGARPFITLMLERQGAFNEATLQALRETSLQLDSLTQRQQHLEMQCEEAAQRIQALETERHAMAALLARHDLGPFYESIPAERRQHAVDQTRGNFEDISRRQAMYVERFLGAPGPVLDLGCGRGELLTQLQAAGLACRGVDIDPAMVEQCVARGLEVTVGTALAALEACPDHSLGGIFAAQVVEHFFPGDLLRFLQVARHKLMPNGMLVLETINAASLGALAKSYYRDLDHKQALHPDYLKLLAELAGFVDVTLHFSSPFRADERIPPLPPASELGLAEPAHAALAAAFGHIDGALYAPQDYHIAARQPA